MRPHMFTVLALVWLFAAGSAQATCTPDADNTLRLSQCNTLADAASALSTSGGTLVVDTSEILSGNLAIDPSITLKFVRGSVLTISGSRTLTVSHVEAGPWQIFAWSEGDLYYTDEQTPRWAPVKILLGDRYPEWFGAQGDGVLSANELAWEFGTNDSDAFQAALNSFNDGSWIRTNGGCRLVIPGGVYRIDGTLTADCANIMIVGRSNYQVPMLVMLTPNARMWDVTASGVHFENITMRGDGASGNGGTDATVELIRVYKAGDIENPAVSGDANVSDDFTLVNCALQYAATAVDIRGRNVRIHRNNFSGCMVGIKLVGALNPSGSNRDPWISENRFHSFGYPHTDPDLHAYCILIDHETAWLEEESKVNTGAWSEVHVVNNLADDCETFAGGILRSGSFVGNTIQRNAKYDVFDLSTVGQTSLIRGVLIEANNIYFYSTITPAEGGTIDNGRVGVGIKTAGIGFSVVGNYILQAYEAGIKVGASSAHVTGNTILNAWWAAGGASNPNPEGNLGAIEIEGNNSIIMGNAITRDTTSSQCTHAVRVVSGAHRIGLNQALGSGMVSQLVIEDPDPNSQNVSFPQQIVEIQPDVRFYYKVDKENDVVTKTNKVIFNNLPGCSDDNLTAGQLCLDAAAGNVLKVVP